MATQRWIPGQNRPRPLGGGSATPTGPAGGDLSGTYPNPTVVKINGSPLGVISAATPGDILVAKAGVWHSVTMSGDATIDGDGVVTVTSTPGSAAGMESEIDFGATPTRILKTT